MDSGVFAIREVKPVIDLVNEALNFNPVQISSVDGGKLSQFNICLSQYLIYFKYQMNLTHVEVKKKKRFIDSTVNQLMTKELIKMYKTKTDARSALVESTVELSKVQEDIDSLQDELYLLEGVDNMIQELIASFKRELTRREHEAYSTRLDRRN